MHRHVPAATSLQLRFPPPSCLLLFLSLFFLCFRSNSRLLQLPCIIVASSAPYPPPLLNFNVENFAVNGNEVEIVQEGDWYSGKQHPSITDGSLWLTPDPRLANSTEASILGRVVHNGAFFLPADVSFSTLFRFTIVTNGSVGTCGSGMAFFISTSKQAPKDSIAAGLGLVIFQNNTNETLLPPPAPFFAVEFDTHMSRKSLVFELLGGYLDIACPIVSLLPASPFTQISLYISCTIFSTSLSCLYIILMLQAS